MRKYFKLKYWIWLYRHTKWKYGYHIGWHFDRLISKLKRFFTLPDGFMVYEGWKLTMYNIIVLIAFVAALYFLKIHGY
jgi:hypothetical protein